MKAVVCEKLGPPSALVLGELPNPEPGPREVVVRVAAAGVNFPDTLIIRGHYQFKPDLPFSPGGEAAGVVAAVGDQVETFRRGDRVVALGSHGAFAELMAVAEHKVVPLPDSMDFVTGAGFCLTYGTSYFALKQRAHLTAGETLVVLGAAGGVGLAAVELGRVLGARVIAAASSADKLQVARSKGAEEGINYLEEPLKDRIKALTAGNGADVVYDPVGGDLTEQALRATAWDGRLLVIGFAAGAIPKIPLNLPLLKNNSIVGVFWGVWTEREVAASQQNYQELFDFHRQGKLRPLLSEVLPMEEYVDAFASISERRVKGKVVLQIDPDL